MISQSTWGIRKNIVLRAQWPDLTKDQRAVALAKIALCWDTLTTEDKMDSARELALRAQVIKEQL